MRKRLALLAVLLMAGRIAQALGPADGAIVKTAGSPDVYIVKFANGKSYKRLVLNPQVFQSYGHLKWENLLTVEQSVLDSFQTSELVRVDGKNEIYRLTPQGDTGVRTLVSEKSATDPGSVYTINAIDFANYADAQLAGPYSITRVIDGDTFVVSIDGATATVRLIGVDSPEVTSSTTAAQCYGQEAQTAVRARLTGQAVYLEADPVSGDADKYGRLLRYASLEDGTRINRWLIDEGYAEEYTYAGQQYRYRDEFQTAETTARSQKKGLWSVEVCALAEDFNGSTAYDCESDSYNCTDFKTRSEAQQAYDTCMNQKGYDIHQLDSDDDGTPCETLK